MPVVESGMEEKTFASLDLQCPLQLFDQARVGD